jgi:hypothetical protein
VGTPSALATAATSASSSPARAGVGDALDAGPPPGREQRVRGEEPQLLPQHLGLGAAGDDLDVGVPQRPHDVEVGRGVRHDDAQQVAAVPHGHRSGVRRGADAQRLARDGRADDGAVGPAGGHGGAQRVQVLEPVEQPDHLGRGRRGEELGGRGHTLGLDRDDDARVARHGRRRVQRGVPRAEPVGDDLEPVLGDVAGGALAPDEHDLVPRALQERGDEPADRARAHDGDHRVAGVARGGVRVPRPGVRVACRRVRVRNGAHSAWMILSTWSFASPNSIAVFSRKNSGFCTPA